MNYIQRRTAGEYLAKPENPFERKSDLDLNTEQLATHKYTATQTTQMSSASTNMTTT